MTFTYIHQHVFTRNLPFQVFTFYGTPSWNLTFSHAPRSMQTDNITTLIHGSLGVNLAKAGQIHLLIAVRQPTGSGHSGWSEQRIVWNLPQVGACWILFSIWRCLKQMILSRRENTTGRLIHCYDDY